MSDEQFYLEATNEIEGENPISALWAKAMALAEGNPEKAKYHYINLRVDQLKSTKTIKPDACDSSADQEIPSTNGVLKEPVKSNPDSTQVRNNELGFTWWQVWAWLGLTVGNLYIGVLFFRELPGLTLALIAVNTILNGMILSFNKYAFLIATIVSFNPILWIVNGIYLHNRWKHPKINGIVTKDVYNNQRDKSKDPDKYQSKHSPASKVTKRRVCYNCLHYDPIGDGTVGFCSVHHKKIKAYKTCESYTEN